MQGGEVKNYFDFLVAFLAVFLTVLAVVFLATFLTAFFALALAGMVSPSADGAALFTVFWTAFLAGF